MPENNDGKIKAAGDIKSALKAALETSGNGELKVTAMPSSPIANSGKNSAGTATRSAMPPRSTVAARSAATPQTSATGSNAAPAARPTLPRLEGKVYVKDLKDKDHVEGIFLVKTKNTPLAKSGKPYLAMMLGDRTGAIEGRMWENVENILNTFQIDDFVRVRGTVNLYQKRKQLVIGELSRVAKKEVDTADFLPASKFDVEAMYETLLTTARAMKNEYLRQLVIDTLNDPEIAPKYKKCPAARTIHHNWVGGLLEHTLSICKIMAFLASHYENVDLDLLLVGAIFHDIGKIWELSYDSNVTYTDVGKLVGHLVLGSELIEKKASNIAGFPVELKNVCKHIVLSHHGKLEYGSPKLPSTLEALIVAYVDDLDSKITALQSFLHSESTRGDSWTGFNSVFERHFYMMNRTLTNGPQQDAGEEVSPVVPLKP